MGPGLLNAVIAIALVSWVPFTRVTRIKDLPLRHRDFVQATIAISSPRSCILRHHILPKLQTLLHLAHELEQNIALNFGVATAFSLLSGSSILFLHFKFAAVELLAATQLLTGVGIASKPLLSTALTVPKNGSTLD